VVQTSPSFASVAVTAAQLRDAVSAISKAPPKDADSLQGCIKAIIEVLIEHGIEEQQELIETGTAICVRLMAFAALLKSAAIGPWIASPGNQNSPLRKPLLEAMATAPLRLEKGRYQFDPDDFFDIALENTPAAGNG